MKDENNNVLFGVPKNIHFIGMMNDVDKSIDTFDLALRRRFVWIRKDFDINALRNFLNDRRVKKEVREEYIVSCVKLNYFITGCKYDIDIDLSGIGSLELGKSYEFGHSMFMKIPESFFTRKSIKKGAKDILWKEHLEPTLREYLRSTLSEHVIDSELKRAKELFCE